MFLLEIFSSWTTAVTKIYLVAGKAFIMIVYISCDTVIVSVDTECDTVQSAVETIWVAPSSTNGLSNSVKIGGVVLVTGVSKSDILPLCSDAPSGAIILNLGVWCYVANVITQAEFCVDWFSDAEITDGCHIGSWDIWQLLCFIHSIADRCWHCYRLHYPRRPAQCQADMEWSNMAACMDYVWNTVTLSIRTIMFTWVLGDGWAWVLSSKQCELLLRPVRAFIDFIEL